MQLKDITISKYLFIYMLLPQTNKTFIMVLSISQITNINIIVTTSITFTKITRSLQPQTSCVILSLPSKTSFP